MTRIAAAGISFALGIVVARTQDLTGFGEYSAMMAIVNVGIVVGMLGHESLATRSVANLAVNVDAFNTSNSYRRSAARQVWIAGFVLAAILAVALINFNHSHTWSMKWIWLLSLIPIVARTRVSQAVIRGANFAGLALVPDGIVRPLLALLSLLIVYSIAPLLAKSHTSLILVAASVIALATALLCERNFVPRAAQRAADSHHDTAFTTQFSLAMFLSSLLSVVDSQVAMIALGIFANKAEAATYAAADRYAQAAAIVGQSMYLAIAAKVARLSAEENLLAIRKLVSQTVKRVTIGTFALCAVTAIFSTPLLELFGDAYVSGRPVLLCLLAATLANAAAGPVGIMLLMMRSESVHFVIMFGSVCVQIAMLIPAVAHLGALGAALAVFSAKVGWNAAMLFMLNRRHNIGPLLIRS